MIDTKDILERIESDYGNKASEVMLIFENAISKADHLNNSRIIRCVLFLADKNIEKLNQIIEAAIGDPRDVMFWAEYINHEQPDKIKLIRDFNRPFSEADVHQG